MTDRAERPLPLLEYWVRKTVSGLLKSHPDEVRRGTRFQEEARSERLVNLIRLCLLFVWTCASLWGDGNKPHHIVLDFIAGLGAMSAACIVHLRLSRSPYTPHFKYVTTTLDMSFAVGLMIAYAVTEGPVFMFKMPLFVNLLCALGLAAFRFSPTVVLYGMTLAVGSLACLWWWLHAFVGIEYGSHSQHAFEGKLSAYFLTDVLLYTAAFGFLTAVHVLNLRRHMELRVMEAGRAARDEERFLMASGLAHEIRNPLAGISGYAQLIRDTGKADRRHAIAILEDAQRLKSVVDGFLQYARPYSVRPAPLDLVHFLDGFCRRDSLLHRDSLRFETACARLVIRTDAEALNQVIQNLVQNARRFHTADAPIRIRLDGNTGEARIRVEDDGPGVDPRFLSRLFLPFQTSRKEGTGLGLAFARKIARDLGGDVLHESRTPGACFVVVVRPAFEEGRVEYGS